MGFRGRGIWVCFEGRLESIRYVLLLRNLEQFCDGGFCINTDKFQGICNVSTKVGEFGLI